MIKVGDYVVVVSGDYGWTVPGSWGKVIKDGITKRSVSVVVKFAWVNQKNTTDLDEFIIENKHLSPVTKLHRLLYGIED